MRLTSIRQPAALKGQVEYPGPPVMVITGFDPQGIFSSQGADSTIHNATDDHRISGTLKKFIGNHTLAQAAAALNPKRENRIC